MLRILDDRRPKTERMINWKRQRSTAVTSEAFSAGLVADQQHLELVQTSPGGVHESIALPILHQADDANLCRIFLSIAQDTRFERVAQRENVDLVTAREITSKKDTRTQNYMRQAYGMTIPDAHYMEHFDVVLQTEGSKSSFEVLRSISAQNRTALDQALLLIETAQP